MIIGTGIWLPVGPDKPSVEIIGMLFKSELYQFVVFLITNDKFNSVRTTQYGAIAILHFINDWLVCSCRRE